MAESTLSVDYFRILRELVRQLGIGAVYSTGTVGVSSGVVTLTGGTFPSWAGTAAINLEGTFYTVSTRDSGTQVTLDDTTVTVSSGANYALVRTTDDDAESQLTDVQDAIDAGYHEFLYPDVLVDGQKPTWSFLREKTDISSADSDVDYDLPDDFGQQIFGVTVTGSSVFSRAEVVSRDEMRDMQDQDAASGVPRYVAFRPKTFDGSTGERFEMLVHPTPDGVYTMTVEYRVQPDRLSPDSQYPRGGMLHSDTVLKACRAAAERFQDDQSGVHLERFMGRLRASLQIDAAIMQEM